jgi:hypothetical protein
VRGHLAEDSVLFQQAAELVGILRQVSRVDRSAGVWQADPGGNNGTVSGLSSEISFTATPWAAKYSMACAGPGLGHAAGDGENGGAVPEATMRAAHPLAIARWGTYPPLACAARLSGQVSGRAVHRPCAGESPLPSRRPNQPFCKD